MGGMGLNHRIRLSRRACALLVVAAGGGFLVVAAAVAYGLAAALAAAGVQLVLLGLLADADPRPRAGGPPAGR